MRNNNSSTTPIRKRVGVKATALFLAISILFFQVPIVQASEPITDQQSGIVQPAVPANQPLAPPDPGIPPDPNAQFANGSENVLSAPTNPETNVNATVSDPSTPAEETISPESPQNESLDTTTQSTIVADPGPPVLNLALTDLSNRIGVPKESITVRSVEEVLWPNSCLGVSTGSPCLQVLTPGYKIILVHESHIYTYHTNLSTRVVYAGSDLDIEGMKKKTVAYLNSKIASAQTQLDSLNSELSETRTRVDQEVAQFRTEISSLTAEINRITGELNALMDNSTLSESTRSDIARFLADMEHFLNPENPDGLPQLADAYIEVITFALVPIQNQIDSWMTYSTALRAFKTVFVAKVKTFDQLKAFIKYIPDYQEPPAINPPDHEDPRPAAQARVEEGEILIARAREENKKIRTPIPNKADMPREPIATVARQKPPFAHAPLLAVSANKIHKEEVSPFVFLLKKKKDFWLRIFAPLKRR